MSSGITTVRATESMVLVPWFKAARLVKESEVVESM